MNGFWRSGGALDAPGFRTAAWLFRLPLFVGLATGLLVSAWPQTPILALFLALSFAALLWRGRLPAACDPLVALAALVNAAGYVLRIWDVPGYDEFVHAYTSFVVVLVPGFLLGIAGRRGLLLLALLGLALGVLWEGFEWVAGIPNTNAGSDLLMDALGSLAAALWLGRLRRRVVALPEAPGALAE